jgi:hypothetical protein
MNADAFHVVLQTFDMQEYGLSLERAKQALRSNELHFSSGNPVPTDALRNIYEVRTIHKTSTDSLRRQCARVAEVAAQFPAERWRIYAVSAGVLSMRFFVNEQGIGRACIDFTAQR